jgi:hypothetical protein
VGIFYPDINVVWSKEMALDVEVMETIQRHRTVKAIHAKTDKQFTSG